MYRAQRRGGKGRSGMATKEEDFVTRLFIANTHTPVLFFSTRGIAYKLKVWRLPIGNPQSRGKFIKNMLPLQDGETHLQILVLPEDEDRWDLLDVVFATRHGQVRRNKLSDFTQVQRNGKIAMKFDDEFDGIVGVETCTEDDDFLLVSSLGQCIRFRVPDVRVFKGRNSTGVRGIALAEGDEVISLTILRAFRDAGREGPVPETVARDHRRRDDRGRGRHRRGRRGGLRRARPAVSRSAMREMDAHQQFVLTVNERGYGKRSSSYQFSTKGRGGKGNDAIAVNDRIGRLVAAFPVEDEDQIICISDGGQPIRVPVGGDKGIRIAARATQGVTLFDTRRREGGHRRACCRRRRERRGRGGSRLRARARNRFGFVERSVRIR